MVYLNEVKKGEVFNRFRERVFVFLFVFIILPFCVFAQGQGVVNPNSYVHDYYKMPEWEQIDKFAELPYALNSELPQISSKYPSVITDRYGNITLYFDGKPILEIDRRGDLTFFRRGQKIRTTTGDGRLMRRYRWNNKGRCTVENEWNEVLGFEQYGRRSKLMEKFDSHGNITYRYEYDQNGTGTWEFNFVTQVWKRSNLGSPVEERRKSKDGELIAYWKEEDGHLWRIEKTSILINDVDSGGVIDKDSLRWEIVDGKRHKYDRLGTEILETYDREGNLEVSYEWSNHRLQKVVNHTNGTYERHGEFGIVEQGSVTSEGEEVATWRHEWKGTRHLAAYELMLDPLTARLVYSGKYMIYSPEENVEEVRFKVNERNIDWLGQLYHDSGVESLQLGEEILLEDYVYFYEVCGLSVEQLADFFHTTDYLAGNIYEIIHNAESEGKARAGMFVQATYDLPDTPSNQYSKFLVGATFFGEFNQATFTISGTDDTYVRRDAKLLKIQAQDYFEYGEYDNSLSACETFESKYVKDLDDFDNELGKLYLKVLNYKVGSLERTGKSEEAQTARAFALDKFSSLVGNWGQEYVELINRL